MKKRLARLKALSLYEWRLLLTSMLLLPLVALSLRLFGLKRTQSLMSCFVHAESATDLPEANGLKEARTVAHMVSVAAHHGIYRANCLKQSLAVWWLLQLRGIHADLRIGVNKDEEQLHAHSWVELVGEILIGGENADKQYVTIM